MCKMLARSGGEPGVMNVFPDSKSQEILFTGSWAECKKYILENGYGKQPVVAKKQQNVAFDAKAAMVLLETMHAARKNSKEYKTARVALTEMLKLNNV